MEGASMPNPPKLGVTGKTLVGAILMLLVTGVAALDIWLFKITTLRHIFPTTVITGVLEHCERQVSAHGRIRAIDYEIVIETQDGEQRLSAYVAAGAGLKQLHAGDKVTFTVTAPGGYICAIERNGRQLLSLNEYRWRYFTSPSRLIVLVVALALVAVPALIWFVVLRACVYNALGWKIPGNDGGESVPDPNG